MPRAKKPAVETLDRIDPLEDFSDVDGDLTFEFALRDNEGKDDSDRHYVWVHNDPDTIREYRDHMLKYEPVENKAGELIQRRDHVLFSCDEGKFRKRERYKKLQDIKARAAMTRDAQKTLQPYQIGD